MQGAMLDRVLDATYPLRDCGLDRRAYGRLCAARTKTAWGSRAIRRFALVDGARLLASVEQYDLAGSLDGCPIRICGLGSVFSDPAHAGEGHARALIGTLLDRAATSGAGLALLCPHATLEDSAHEGFEAVPLTNVTLKVAEPLRYGAPMTLVRGGEDRDLAAVATMGRVRAEPYRFHLDRDVDFIHHAIAHKRLLAGLAAAGVRQLQFFIAEEGTTAAAYVVLVVEGDLWTLEECGDRDPSGARVGALLQALIAREPAERRPTIRGWLPPRFLPPQVTIASAAASPDVLMMHPLGAAASAAPLSSDAALYWHNDVF